MHWSHHVIQPVVWQEADSGVDIQAVPVPRFVQCIGMRPSATVMEAGAWGASSGQLESARQWIELTTVGTTVSSSPSWPLTVSKAPNTTSLSVPGHTFHLQVYSDNWNAP